MQRRRQRRRRAFNGLNAPGRTEALEEEFHRAGALFVGIQEGRSRAAATRAGRRYVAFRSAADRGVTGCELWMAKGVPVATVGGPIFLRAEDATVIHSDPRCLLVAVRCGALDVDIAVCHAPCNPRTPEQAAAATGWWERLGETLSSRPSAGQVPLVLLADANARLGDPESRHVGPAGAELENANGGPPAQPAA